MRWWYLLTVSMRLLRLRFTHNQANHQIAKQAIADQLSELGGIAMKIGQVVADTEQSSELRVLLSKEKARPLSEMLPLLEQELLQKTGHNIDDIFTTIEESQSAASLGQVHKATLKDGTIVAIKIQYPYIADAVHAELKLAGLMPALGPVKKWGMDINAYKQSLSNNMQQELDYRSEAKRQALMAKQLKVDGLVIPEVYPEWCTRKILVQSWQEGVLLDQTLGWSQLERMIIARTLLLTLFQSIFKVGEVHGDPHLGNSFYRHITQPEVILLDYGCTISIDTIARQALLQLIINTREHQPQNALLNFSAMGFDPKKLVYIARELPLLAQVLCQPFLLDEPFEANQWQIKTHFSELLGDKKWWFRSAGPSNLFLLMRAFQGIVKQLERLQVNLPWWPLLIQAVGKDQIEAVRTLQLPDVALDIKSIQHDMESVSSVLRITVVRNKPKKETIVDLTLPAHAALDLHTIIPDDIREKILSETDFNFKQLKQTLLDNHFSAREILSFEKQNKEYKIWLE